jgi:Methyltransferase FkbM domain
MFSVQGNKGVGSSLLVADGSRSDRMRKRVEVEVISLDDYAADNGITTLDLLKMDVQGGELNALRGARKLLHRTRYLFLETWLVSSYEGQTPHMFEVFDFLRGFGIFPLDFFGGFRNPHGLLSHIDVAYINARLTNFPSHFYRSILNRLIP